ncbi:hypothetical protein [Acidilobus saccharovorans]|uniref:hypothetical protein n=1 Tax=Acidilobus saccharovorans TaxID=242703 RepID=UPI0006628695|nr:hypothetical protein [Acidilobus saccharovorans]
MEPSGTCSVCGVRQARYYRASSGEKLCDRCLFRLLERSMARALSRAAAREDSRFAVPITSFSPSSSMLAAKVLAHVERKFKSKVYVLLPSFYRGLEGLLEGLPQPAEVVDVTVDPPPPGSSGIISCIRYDRSWSLRASEQLGVDIIVMPLARTTSTLVLLESLMTDGGIGRTESLEVLSVNKVKVVNAFYRLEDEAVRAAEFLEGFSEARPACRATITVKGIYLSVAGRPELDHSSEELVEHLAASVTSTCPVCGGASEGGMCRYCKAMGLESLRVTVGPRPLGPGPGY